MLVCMALIWIPSYGQPYVINGDSVYCYTIEETRAIAVKLTDGQGCAEQLSYTLEELAIKDSLLVISGNIEKSLQAEINILGATVNLHLSNEKIYKDQINRIKRRSRGTILLCGIVTGLTIFLAVK